MWAGRCCCVKCERAYWDFFVLCRKLVVRCIMCSGGLYLMSVATEGRERWDLRISEFFFCVKELELRVVVRYMGMYMLCRFMFDLPTQT